VCSQSQTKKVRCEKGPSGCSNCTTSQLRCDLDDECDESLYPQPTFVPPPTPSPEGRVYAVQTPDAEQYHKALSKYMRIYEQFPLIHPYILTTMYESAQGQREDEKNYLWAMIDAISSLISWYTEGEKTAEAFYESAKKRLDTLKRRCIERFVTCTILVSRSTPQALAVRLIANSRLSLGYIMTRLERVTYRRNFKAYL